MLSSYIKLSLRVLTRNKFFTAISLFGISFTLAILMLIVSFLQSELGDAPPVSNRDRMVVMRHAQLNRMVIDTIYQVDSAMVNGVMTYDSTFTTNERSASSSNGPFNHEFLQEYFSDVTSAENYTVHGGGLNFNAFINNTKLPMAVELTDANYWEVFDYDFTEGAPYGQQEAENGNLVAVLTEKFAEEYFGQKKGLIGEEVVIDGKSFAVVGIVKTPSTTTLNNDIYAPITSLIDQKLPNPIMGPFNCIQLASSPSEVKKLKADIDLVAASVPIPSEIDYNKFRVRHGTYDEMFARMLYYEEEAADSYRILSIALISLIAFFILLPVLNLINLNVGKIFDRSAEIGVRKAMGAGSGQIMTQFVIENVILTIIGGIIGLALALFLIYTINDKGLMGNTTLVTNWSFFFYSFIVSLFFGILSGLLPAYRMARLDIVNALKSNHL